MPDLSAEVDAADALLRVSGALRTYLDDALTRHNVSWAGFEVGRGVYSGATVVQVAFSLTRPSRDKHQKHRCELGRVGSCEPDPGIHRRDEYIVGATLKGQRTFERSRNSIETASRDLLSQNDALGLLAHIVGLERQLREHK